ncbi:MAG: HAD family hydrolase [Campylobacterales bacterium]
MANEIIIFDLDGTLVDSGDNIAAAINHTRASFGLSPLGRDYVLDNINRDDINAADVFYGTKSFTEEQRAIFEPYYYEICAQNVRLYEKIDFFLDEFRTNGFKMAVATNGKTEFAKKILDSLDISNYFDAIIGADRVALPKPNPEMLLKALDGMGADDDASVIMVGDSIKDVKAARAIKIPSVVVEWGFGEDKPVGDKNLTHGSELNWIIDFFKD